ncbi:MAG: hypothetical protein H7842_02605 [Gammaproteobacteria bacterium SHHR-1]
MSLNELIPELGALSHADKFQLVQIILQQLAEEEGIALQEQPAAAEAFDPRAYFGVTQHGRQELEYNLKAMR